MGRRIDAYWAEFFGIEPAGWTGTGVIVRAHVGLRGFRGLWCFRRRDRVVVSAPLAWVADLRTRWAGWEPARLVDPTAVAVSLGEACERIVGPAFQGTVTSESFWDVASPRVRAIRSSDRPQVEQFRARCGEEAWSVSGLEKVGPLAYVDVEGADVTAMAGLRDKSDGVGDVCVLTDPRVRGQGRGAAVVGAVTRDALAHGKLVLYQTLESNRAAVRLALSLGYERYANHLAVRLNHDVP